MLLSTPKNAHLHFFSNLPDLIPQRASWHSFCRTGTVVFYQVHSTVIL